MANLIELVFRFHPINQLLSSGITDPARVIPVLTIVFVGMALGLSYQGNIGLLISIVT